MTGIAGEDMRGRCLSQEKSPQMVGYEVTPRNALLCLEHGPRELESGVPCHLQLFGFQ